MGYLSSRWNNSVSLLRMYFNAQLLSVGTCFFWKCNSRVYLVTNWHNLSGRNPLSGECISIHAAIPNRIEALVYRKLTENDAHGYYHMEYVPIKLELNSVDSEKPLWKEHPVHRGSVDVATLDISELIEGYDILCVNELESDAVLSEFVAQEAFVVGFPFGEISGAPAPVWKRATIALDPTFDISGLPKMLLDTSTREGMSGSVVIGRKIILGSDYTKKDGTRSETILYGVKDVVIGIYSGRHYPDFEKAQLGIAWKRKVIDEIILGNAYYCSP